MTTDGAPVHLLARWNVRVDGAASAGWMGRVWPVLGPRGERWVLKVTDAHHPPTGEARALRAWGGTPRGRDRVVRLVDEHDGALLLERLDAARTLSRVADIDEADGVLAAALADLAGVPAPDGTPALSSTLERVAHSVRDHREEAPDDVHPSHVARALDTLAAVGADLTRPGAAPPWLLHFDLHYENVLAAPEGDPRDWVVIDPLPHAGIPEVEVVAALRNRFDDAVATGDPQRHLRRRLDRLTEAAGLRRGLAAALTQAVAVDNVLWLARRHPDHPLLPAYRLLIHW